MKTLKDIVTEVQEVTGLSKSELSRRIGKSRNYLVSVVKAGLTYDNEKALIQKLHAVAEQEYYEFEKLRQNLEIAEEKIIERNEDFRKLSKKYKDSEHKVVLLQRQIDLLSIQREEYQGMAASRQMHVNTLKDEVDLLSHSKSDTEATLINKLHQERIKNRFLTGAVLFVLVVSVVYLGVKAYGY